MSYNRTSFFFFAAYKVSTHLANSLRIVKCWKFLALSFSIQYVQYLRLSNRLLNDPLYELRSVPISPIASLCIHSTILPTVCKKLSCTEAGLTLKIYLCCMIFSRSWYAAT